MNELKLINGYWTDKNNNRWNTEYYNEQDAIKASNTIKDCKDCIDCMDCIDCKNCIGCYSCKNCENCRICEGCENCTNCIGCYSCVNCNNCTNAFADTFCKNLSFEKETEWAPKYQTDTEKPTSSGLMNGE